MFTRKLCSKFFSVKGFGARYVAFLHKDAAIRSPSLSNCHKNQFFIGFSSLVDVNPCGTNSELKNVTKIATKLAKDNTFTVSYLMSSCGLSRETAVSVSKKVHFDTPEKPDSVLALFKKYGFSTRQVATLIRKRPLLLLFNPQKTILPKLEFLWSLGVSGDLLASILSRDPTLLWRSLENAIIPYYNFLKTLLLTNEAVVVSMQRSSWYFKKDSSENITLNIVVLKDLNVPHSNVVYLLTHFPQALCWKSNEFKASVSQVLEMGFDPLRWTFLSALHVISGKSNKGPWSRCFKTYTNWGWSKDDIYMAFKKHPNCMLLSKKKISKAMDLFVNKMGLESRRIARCPTVLFLSLETRLLPRCSVAMVLISKGLIDKDQSLTTLLIPPEKYFLKKFVKEYETQVPKLCDLYKGKVHIEEL